MADLGEVERRELADRRELARSLDRSVGLRFRRLHHRLGFGISRAVAGRKNDPQRRPPEPLLHRRAHRRRGDRGISGERLFVEVAVVREGLPFGERHRFAAEAADLLELADAGRNFAHHRALDLVRARTLGDIIGKHLIEPLRHHRRIDARPHISGNGKDADLFPRCAGLSAIGAHFAAGSEILDDRAFRSIIAMTMVRQILQ